MTTYRNQECFHKENCNALLAYHSVNSLSQPLNTISLSADNPQFESILHSIGHTHIEQCLCVEKDREIYDKLCKVVIKNGGNARFATPIHDDIFNVINKHTHRFNVMQFDFCGLYTKELHQKIIYCITSDDVSTTSIFSLTTSWNHYSDEVRKFHVYLQKTFTKSAYTSPSRFRKYGLIESIQNIFAVYDIKCDILANFGYAASTGKSNHGTQMQFQIFKIIKQ